MMQVKMLSDTEGWLGGTGFGPKAQLEAHFWYTSDGGKTWALKQVI